MPKETIILSIEDKESIKRALKVSAGATTKQSSYHSISALSSLAVPKGVHARSVTEKKTSRQHVVSPNYWVRIQTGHQSWKRGKKSVALVSTDVDREALQTAAGKLCDVTPATRAYIHELQLFYVKQTLHFKSDKLSGGRDGAKIWQFGRTTARGSVAIDDRQGCDQWIQIRFAFGGGEVVGIASESNTTSEEVKGGALQRFLSDEANYTKDGGVASKMGCPVSIILSDIGSQKDRMERMGQKDVSFEMKRGGSREGASSKKKTELQRRLQRRLDLAPWDQSQVVKTAEWPGPNG
ncbi:hypothetical protein IW262DRAFT_1301268 [Armillaria fumosa]|nr:hypothetical protein IW262DRAFT_1301268 [Armillaria fumosa]